MIGTRRESKWSESAMTAEYHVEPVRSVSLQPLLLRPGGFVCGSWGFST